MLTRAFVVCAAVVTIAVLVGVAHGQGWDARQWNVPDTNKPWIQDDQGNWIIDPNYEKTCWEAVAANQLSAAGYEPFHWEIYGQIYMAFGNVAGVPDYAASWWLATYGKNPANLQTAGNVFLGGAKPSANERGGLLVADAKPATALETKPDGLWLAMPLDPAWVNGRKRHLVTTASLGKAMVSGAAYEKPDATAYRLDTDYAGQQRDAQNPAPGPFRCPSKKAPPRVKVWPKNGARQPSRR